MSAFDLLVTYPLIALVWIVIISIGYILLSDIVRGR